MVGHIRLCLDEIEAEIDSAGFSLFGARAREILAQHIEGIRAIVEAADVGQTPREVTSIACAVAATPAPIDASLDGAAGLSKAA